MRLQLISFAWRILNTPGACFAAVSSVRDNSIREVMEREELWQPPAIPWPRGSDPPGFKEKIRKMETSHTDGKVSGWGARLCFGGTPLALPACPQTGHPACSPPGPCPGSQPAQLGSAGVFLLVSVPTGLAPDHGCTKAWGHQTAEVWHVWGAVPRPIPLREVPQVQGMGSDLQTLSIRFPPFAGEEP